MTKSCICCRKDLPISSYYRHPRMADGHLNKCKECVIAYQSKRLAAKLATLEGRMAERERGREKYHRLYRHQTPKTPPKAERLKLYRERAKASGKRQARNAVNNAIRNCRLTRLPCADCGNSKSEAHHPDYSKPLEVVWLCHPCHMRIHRKKD